MRHEAMAAEYASFAPDFEDIRTYMTTRLRSGEGRTNREIIDATARDALRTFESGMMAGMTSPSRPWFKLGIMGSTALTDLSQASREWLHKAERLMYAVMQSSNVYQMLASSNRDLGLYGTHASMMMPDFDDVIRAQIFHVGEFFIATDDKGMVNSLHRKYTRTVDQIVKRFGLKNCTPAIQDAYTRGNLGDKHKVCMAIEPRRKRNPLSPLPQDMPWMVAFWLEESQEGEFLQISGHKRKRFIACRWDVDEPDVWGLSPAMDALGDSAQLQDQHATKATATQKMADPPMQAPTALNRTSVKNFPGGITFANTKDLNKGGYRPLYEVNPDINALREDIGDTQERIRGAFFSDLFQMFTHLDRRQITAEEILKRYEEKVLLLGPVLDRMDKERNDPLVMMVFEEAMEADVLGEPPEEIAGSEIKIEYTSMLAQAQKMIGIQSMERAIGFAGTLGQVDPEALDNLDGDDMMREAWPLIGAAPTTLRSKDEVAKEREARAKQQEQAAMMENAQPMANAAKLISEANQRSAGAI